MKLSKPDPDRNIINMILSRNGFYIHNNENIFKATIPHIVAGSFNRDQLQHQHLK